VIELAEASGLRRLRREEFDPLRATTLGTGELIRCALDYGANRILLAVGGSATVDGGAGILQALGVRFRNAQSADLSDLPEDLVALESMDLSGLDSRALRCGLTVLCDVENPLLGPQGAAPIFGPQKGATESTVKKLELVLTNFAGAVRRGTGRDITMFKHGGAAGGVAAGLHGVLNAGLVKGIDCFLDLTGFEAALSKADLVITGEGRLDGQTLEGKGPIGVALRARKKKIPVIALAGRIAPEALPALGRHFDQVLPITDASVELETALRETAVNLEQAAFTLASHLQTG
jgi:glycerate kinase